MSTTEVQAPESAPQPQHPASEPPPLTVIEPRRGWQLLNVRELWHYRELLYFLTWRDVAVRYKQTVLGAAWAVLQPAMMMVVFTVFLGRMAKVDSGGLPYPVFVYAGLLPWTFFATAVAAAGNSVVGSAHMISKVYCPRLMIPLASVGAAVVDFLIALSLMAILMVYYGIAPGWGILLLPMVFGLIFLAATGVGTLLAALNVRYRDFKYTIPFLLQIWMFATPTVYMNVEPRADASAAQEALPSPSGRAAAPEALSSPSGRGAGGEGLAQSPASSPSAAAQGDLPSPSGRGAGGEGAVRPASAQSAAVGQADLPSPSGRGAGGEGLAQSPASARPPPKGPASRRR